MTPLLAVAIKVSIVLLAALALTPLLRGRSAALRHWIMAAAIAAAAATPLLAALVPAWSLPAAVSSAEPDVEVVTTTLTVTGPGDVAAPGTALEPGGPPDGAAPWGVLLAVWAAGTVAALAVLLAGLLRLRRIARAATPLTGGRWVALAAEVASGYGLRRPIRLLLHGREAALPVTWGLLRPTIVLPSTATAWDEDRIRVVLCHELAHIHRGDWAVQMLAELLRALHWYNPLVWVACRRLRQESEQACDDAVLNAGVAGPAYASEILELARAFVQHHRAWSPALPVARPSGLERRVRAMLSPSVNRVPLSRRARVATLLASFVGAVAIAGAGLFAQGPFATVSGSITDPQRAALPGAALVMTNTQTQAKNEVRSDAAGRFEFVGLPPGEYVLQSSVPGFKTFTASLALNGELIERDIPMDIGTLEETITVTGDDTPPRPVDPQRQARMAEMMAKRASRACTAAQPSATGRPIGGNIRPPVKLRDVRPLYPPVLRDAKVGGTVLLLARIGTDGAVADVTLRESAHPELDAAAIDAVRQWQFDQTLLNCVPVEVAMTVNVTFRPAP